MSKGIDDSDCFIVFITEEYIAKVNGDNAGDNCKLEFNYAARRKTKKLMIAVVLEASCRDTSKWSGSFGFTLCDELFVDFVNDRDFDKNLSNLYEEINKRINLPPQSTTIPLVNLSINDVGILARKLSMSKHVDDFISNDINGKHLNKCETVDDLSDILGSISISKIKGDVFLEKIKELKLLGVPSDMLN